MASVFPGMAVVADQTMTTTTRHPRTRHSTQNHLHPIAQTKHHQTSPQANKPTGPGAQASGPVPQQVRRQATRPRRWVGETRRRQRTGTDSTTIRRRLVHRIGSGGREILRRQHHRLLVADHPISAVVLVGAVHSRAAVGMSPRALAARDVDRCNTDMDSSICWTSLARIA